MNVFTKIILINLMTVTTIIYGNKENKSETFLHSQEYVNQTELHAEISNGYFR